MPSVLIGIGEGESGLQAKKKLPKTLKYVLRSLPLAGAVASLAFPLSAFGRQFMMLIVLLWVQAYFILEILLAGR